MNYNIKERLAAIYILLIVICVPAFAVKSISLHFFDSALVNNKVVYLNDIAEIKGNLTDNNGIDLNGIKVGDAAPAGYNRYMNVYDIVHFILNPQLTGNTIITSGAKRVKVRTDSKTRKISDFEDQILEYLFDNICWEKNEYTVSIRNPDNQWQCYRKPSTITIKGLSSPYPKGNVRIKLVITQDDLKLTVPVICKIGVQVPVVCVKETIQRNKVIKEQDLELIRMDITNYRFTPITEITAATGKIAVKTLSMGTIIHNRCAKALPVVCKGDNVLMVIKKGPVQISVPARAREEGVKGDRIWVENLKTHKLIRVKIAGKGVVHFNEGEAI